MSAPAATEQRTQALREAAAELLSGGTVDAVIGYGRPDWASFSSPAFVRTAEDVEQLIFDNRCYGNLAVYLSKPHVQALGRIGVVVKGCDRKAVNVLLRENVIQREAVVLLGVCCAGVGDPPLAKCAVCDVHTPADCDVVVGEPVDAAVDEEKRYAKAKAVEAMSLQERWAYWSKQLGKCIRCYACRQICPLCYCKRCIVEKSTPPWVETSAHLRGNLAWHVARAMHLTGRCVGCGECERVCPMDIPLSALNQEMAKFVDESYGFRSGQSAEETGPFSTFSVEDADEGIL